MACRCRRNVYMLAVAFLCNFASYMTLESMQSSLNRGIGTNALSLLYITLVVSSLFLPPLVIAKLDCRKSLFLSILSYASYTLANFYPKPYTLLPAALFLGMGSSVMWTCAFYYIMQLSQKHAMEKKKSVEEVTGEFFGKFTAISHISILVGTLFMSVVFESIGSVTDDVSDVLVTNISQTTTPQQLILNESYFSVSTTPMNAELTTYNEVSETKCGLYYKFADSKVEKDKDVSNVIMYILLSAFLAFNVIAAFLCLCLDDMQGAEAKPKEEPDGVCASMTSLNSNRLDAYVVNNEDEPEKKALAVENNNTKGSQQTVTSTFKLLKSTLKILTTDKAAWLLIFFTLHYGMIQGFARGVYNASWVTCALGIKYVAYVTCMYAVVMIVFCYIFGKLLRFTSHAKIFLCTMSLEICIFVVLLIWQPNPPNGAEIIVFFAVPFGLGITHSSLSSQIGSIYSKFFSDNKKSGASLQNIWNPMGSAIAYGLSGPLFPFHMIIIVMSVCVVGTLLYLIAEKIKDKPYRKCSGKSCF